MLLVNRGILKSGVGNLDAKAFAECGVLGAGSRELGQGLGAGAGRRRCLLMSGIFGGCGNLGTGSKEIAVFACVRDF